MARITEEACLTGWVRNQSGTVRLVLEGPAGTVDRFMSRLKQELPPRARLEGVHVLSRESLEPHEVSSAFTILESASDSSMRISIPADLAICPRCMEEVLDPSSRFYRYPFTTCTDCGPRYTVVEAMPYDRERTALRDFPLCSECMGEYTDPLNRRFHAESIACPVCGPELVWKGPEGKPIAVEDPLKEARRAIAEGRIIGVKGLGGFLLVADAANRNVLEQLRRRKKRPSKPFAVMARNMKVLQDQCAVSRQERDLLASPEAPITVLKTLPGISLPVDLLAPGLGNLGVMLPTTPLHLLLAQNTGDDPTGSFDFLLMTSGNRSGEPICTTNDEAVHRLSGIADFFLVHDRRINLRNDDSLAVVNDTQVQLWRRARGYAPESISIPRPLSGTVLAMGAELKNTICLGFGDEAVMSPHIGDLETPEALDGLEQVVRNFPEYFGKVPESVAVDLHPDMHSTRLGRKLASELDVPVVEVQHHYAHALSVMCENSLDEAVALVFDGTGLGTDGTIWGGELLHVREEGWTRLGTLAPADLPGGDAAVLRPAIQLISRFWRNGLQIDSGWMRKLDVTEEELAVWKTQVDRRINCFTTHAAGRVFDAFSAGTGISPARVRYEGEAAILLEAEAMSYASGQLPELDFSLHDREGLLVTDLAPAFRRLHEECPGREQGPQWAAAFHRVMVRAAVRMIDSALETTGGLPVVLSGGVMMNRYMSTCLLERLAEKKIQAHVHRFVPPNDGGISLGQVCAAGRTC